MKYLREHLKEIIIAIVLIGTLLAPHPNMNYVYYPIDRSQTVIDAGQAIFMVEVDELNLMVIEFERNGCQVDQSFKDQLAQVILSIDSVDDIQLKNPNQAFKDLKLIRKQLDDLKINHLQQVDCHPTTNQ